MALLESTVVQLIGLALLHFLWQGVIIGGLYGLTLRLLRPQSANTRYAIGVFALFLLALTPVATMAYLWMTAPIPGVASATAASSAMSAAPHVLEGSGAAATATFQSLAGVLPWLVAAWLLGVCILSLRLLAGWRYLIHLRRTADTDSARFLQENLERLRLRLGIGRHVQLALSRKVHSPLLLGWFKPLILIPPSVICGLPVRQIEMVLAHELAHIRRHDHLVNLFQVAVETLLFYHPVVTWVSRRIRIERENACDDLAVAATDNRLAYVRMLASLELLRSNPPRLAMALGAQDGQIVGRIRRLVQEAGPRTQRGGLLPAMLLITLTGGLTSFAMLSDSSSSEEEQDAPSAPTAAIEAPIIPDNPDPGGPAMESEPGPAPDSLTSAPGQDQAIRENELVNVAPATPVETSPTASGEAPAAERESSTAGQGSTELASAPSSTPPAGQEARSASPTEAPGTGREEDARATRTSNPDGDPGSRPEPPPSEATSPTTDSTAEQGAAEESQTEAIQVEEVQAATDFASLTDTLEPPSGTQLAMLNTPRSVEPGRADFEAQPAGRIEPPEPPRISGGDIVRRITPDFPPRARRSRADGLVELEFLVDTSGQVRNVRVLDESPRGMDFGSHATAAVRQWVFEPFRHGEETISRKVRMEVEFDLRQACHTETGTRIPRC